MRYDELISGLGYTGAPLFCEDDRAEIVAPSDRHWIRAARAAGVRGTYLFRTSPERQAFRAAVHVAEATTLEEAREIHRRLWNQGVNPFVIVVLPDQVRVFTGFAYNPDTKRKDNGDITNAVEILEALATFTADAINRGDVWRDNAHHLRSETRVDATLLEQLENLGKVLLEEHDMSDRTCHSLIGKFVYLSYLRARGILSDEWIREEADLVPEAVFRGKVFSPDVTLQSFRRVAKAVETRFNGRLFPVPWGSPRGPRAAAIRTVARVFAGEQILSGQLHLPFTAYDFANIPVEFLSSIYEQFLHAEGIESPGKVDVLDDKEGVSEGKVNASDPEKRGAHYTPEPLADYLISEIDSVRSLKAGMRILDPCCGSGVFLVVTYRRLVELECQRQRRDVLSTTELRDLLVSNIFGVERNPTACQIAAFSLILTLLSYVKPPELHVQKDFKFPTLFGNNLFRHDFFNESGGLWKLKDSATGAPLSFDWIVGNPPWVELKGDDPRESHILAWSKKHASEYGLARARTGEAFAWKVMKCLATGGTVGLILHAKTLTNDHLKPWRKAFFGGVHVHRLTNFANMAYVIFPSAEQPALTIVYSHAIKGEPPHAIVHVGPFVANQMTIGQADDARRQVWTMGFSESEIKVIKASSAASGSAFVWKFGLWGNQRDIRTVQRIQRLWSTTLGELADSRGWQLELGLQLRSDAGANKKHPNTYVKNLEDLLVFDHESLLRARRNGAPVFAIPKKFLIENRFGCYVRGNRLAGVTISRGPHVFLWTDFAALGEGDFIIRHDKIGLAGGSISEMKAVAAVWSSSYISYLLFFVLSAAWGIAYSTIDKGDATQAPFPELTPERERELSAAWDDAVALETNGASFNEVKELLDERVAKALNIPTSISLVVREFFRVRYQLNKGKSPKALRASPSEAEIKTYAARLTLELDAFLGGRARHAITVLQSAKGVCASIRLTAESEPILPQVRFAAGAEATMLESFLLAAEQQFSQWVYVKRSVRIFDGDTIHLIKPPRRLEWTETQALLDADDVIAEVIEQGGRT